MTAADIVIQHGLPDDQRQRAAAIFYDGFAGKFSHFMDRERGIQALAALLDPACALVAMRSGQVVGIAGVHGHDSRLVRWQPGVYRQYFGPVRGMWVASIMRFYYRPQRPGELLMDGLAVDPALRGQGIGTLLLDAVQAYAREQGYHQVRLDVVDTNPRARQLYERVGFRPVHTYRYPGLRHLAGFSAHTAMIKPVSGT